MVAIDLEPLIEKLNQSTHSKHYHTEKLNVESIFLNKCVMSAVPRIILRQT